MITTICIVNCYNCYLTIVKNWIQVAVNKIDIPYKAILKAQINIFANQLQMRNSTITYMYPHFSCDLL